MRQHLQLQEVPLYQYLDDWLTHGSNEGQVKVNIQKILYLTEKLGWIVNMEKSELEPAQRFKYLSYNFLLDLQKVAPTEDRWEKIRKKILPLVEVETCTAREWQSVLGLLTSTEKLVNMGMLHIRPIQLGMLTQWSPFKGDPEQVLVLSAIVKECLKWWTVRENVMTGVPIVKPSPKFQMFTDASLEGWGGTLNDMEVHGKWSQEETQYHINVLELMGIWRVLQHFQDVVQGSTVMTVPTM